MAWGRPRPLPSQETMDEARAALKSFRALQPVLTAYARQLTGRADVEVRAVSNSNGSTDGKVIYYRPPIALGKNLPHQRWHCDKRGPDGAQLCPACAQREQVLATIYHEIAHIWFDSFAKSSNKAKRDAIEASLSGDYTDTSFGDAIRKRIEATDTRYLTYVELSNIISPWMGALVNSLEDARIENALFRALPGTKPMFEHDVARVFREGVEGLSDDGMSWDQKKWSDRELNHQVLAGLYCKAAGYDYSEWFNEWVVKTLDDSDLTVLVDEARKSANVDGVFSAAFPILAMLRKKWGYFKADTDPTDLPDEVVDEPEDEPDQPDVDQPSQSQQSEDNGDEQDGEDSSPSEGDTPEETPAEPDEPSESDESQEGSDGDSAPEPAEGDEADAEGSDESSDEGGAEDSDESDPEGDSGGDDSEGSDEGDSSDPAGSDDDAGAPGQEGEEVDESADDGGDSPERGSAGRPEADEEADGGSQGGGAGAGPADPEPGESDGSDDDVPEDVPGGADPGVGSDDSDPDHDGEGSDGDLDGLPGDDPGTAEFDQPVDRSRPDGDESSGGSDSGDGDDELIDTSSGKDSADASRGDDDGDLPKPDLEWGSYEDIKVIIAQATGHEAADDTGHKDVPHANADETPTEDEAMTLIVTQGDWFETPSRTVHGVKIFKEGERGYLGGIEVDNRFTRKTGVFGDFTPPEAVVGKAVMEARIVFTANDRGKYERGLRRGRVHANSLATRAPFNDPRMMQKKILPGHESYFVLIGIDISGSTRGVNLDLEKRVAFAEAEMLHRLGIPFEMWAHSGQPNDESVYGLHMHLMKDADEAWSDACRKRLSGLASDWNNLDGHTFEFYRKRLDKRREKTRILHYYTDGEMPYANYAEELAILQREIKVCRTKGYIPVGIGINTDSPKAHGLDTVLVRDVPDVSLVVTDLKKRLIGR